MLRLMIGGLAAIAAGLVGGLAVMPVKASPRTVVVIAGPSLPLPGPVQSSSPEEAAPPAPKAVPAAAPRIHTADEPAPRSLRPLRRFQRRLGALPSPPHAPSHVFGLPNGTTMTTTMTDPEA